MHRTGAGASELAVSTLHHLMRPFGPSTVWQAIHGMLLIGRVERAPAVCWLFLSILGIVCSTTSVCQNMSVSVELYSAEPVILSNIATLLGQDQVCKCGLPHASQAVCLPKHSEFTKQCPGQELSHIDSSSRWEKQ